MSDVTGKIMLIVDTINLDFVESQINNWSKPLRYSLEHRKTPDCSYSCLIFEKFESSVQLEVFDEILKCLHDKNIDYATPTASVWSMDEEFKYFFEKDEETERINNDSFEELPEERYISKKEWRDYILTHHLPYKIQCNELPKSVLSDKEFIDDLVQKVYDYAVYNYEMPFEKAKLEKEMDRCIFDLWEMKALDYSGRTKNRIADRDDR